MKQRLIGLGLGVAAAAVLGVMAAWAGLIPVAASSGHWAVTDWFLHFTMRQSVELQAAWRVKPPEWDLDDPALILRGAGHYASGCAPCHGAPEAERSVIVRHMTPAPPYLPPRIPLWEPAELFWIVKHGVKFTAMPAWPAGKRDDEIWAVVAFLLRLPQLTPQRYAELTGNGEPESGSGGAARLESLSRPAQPLLDGCANCHGREGEGRGDAFPVLAGQSESYLFASLNAFSRGERHSGFMQPVAATLSESQMRRLARHFAQARPAGPRQRPQARDAEARARARGERIAREGVPDQGVPPCISCHGPSRQPRNAIYPSLAGQSEWYLVQQLKLWREGTRGGTPYAHIMRTVGERLNPRQIDDLALYYSRLDPMAGASE